MVTYVQPFLQFRAHGILGPSSTAPVEAWSWGLKFSVPGSGLDEAKKIAFLQTVQVAVKTFHTSSAVVAHPQSFLSHLTAAYIDTDGHYVGGSEQPTTEYAYQGTLGAGAGAAGQPYSHAICFTLTSNIDRGSGSRGRFYVPSGMAVATDGRWTATQANNAMGAAKTMLQALGQAAKSIWSPAGDLSTFSGVTPTSVDQNPKRGTVLTVGVGRAPDTQRRRDNKLLEERVDSVLNPELLAELVSGRVYTGKSVND